MKVSDYIAEFLMTQGVDTVFGYQGSSISHLIDSICNQEGLTYVQTNHEQAAAFSACGYAIAKGQLGVALSCSGPGATNLITGIANAYFDSIPCLFITGQVSTGGIRTNRSMRQLGFQETDIVSIVNPITKYAVSVLRVEDLEETLKRAVKIALTGRKGPVVIDIPHNIQNAQFEPGELCKKVDFLSKNKIDITNESIDNTINEIKNAKRPLALIGGGCANKGCRQVLQEFIGRYKIPLVSSYLGKACFDNSDELFIGTVGSYGNRFANHAVLMCDLLIVLGSRLDGRQTNDNCDYFTENKKVIYVDIDEVELSEKSSKFIKCKCDVVTWLRKVLEKNIGVNTKNIEAWNEYLRRIVSARSQQEEYLIHEYTNPNKLISDISKSSQCQTIYSADVGQNQIWVN